MSEFYNQTITELVAEYEAMLEMGTMAYLDEPSLNRLIEYYEQDEQIDRALEVTAHAIRHHQFSGEFHLKRAELLVGESRLEEALESLDQAAVFIPHEPELALLRAEVFIYRSWYEEGFAVLEELKAEADSGLLSDIYFIESIAYDQQEMHERMYFALRASLAENPDNQDALERIWYSIDACKRYDEATGLFEEILEHNAYSSLAWFNLGHAKAYQGRYAEAIDCYEYAFLSDEQFEQAYRDCAELCFEMKHYHRALRCYEDLLERFDSDNDTLLHIGLCHQHLGNFKIAATFYVQALNYDPMDDEVLYRIGECFAHEQNWKEAIRYFQKAIAIEETREEYFGALAEACHQYGDLQEAELNFERAVETAPEESRYWIRYALFLLHTQRGEEALELLDEAEDTAVGSDLIYCRVVCLFITGRRQEGLYWLGEALEEDYDGHRLLFGLHPDLEYDPDIISMISAYMM